jgi:hypothetical protein
MSRTITGRFLGETVCKVIWVVESKQSDGRWIVEQWEANGYKAKVKCESLRRAGIKTRFRKFVSEDQRPVK